MKKQSSRLAIPFGLIGGGIAMFITTEPIAFFFGMAGGIILGYIFTGMCDQATGEDNKQDDNK